MAKFYVYQGDLTLEATLIRDGKPRLAICQDRVVLLNKFNRVMAHRDMLCMFTTTEMVDAAQDPKPEWQERLKKPQLPEDRRKAIENFQLNGDIANYFNEMQDEDEYGDGEYGF